ncbi:uncharacterized protein LOC113003203 isoform X2 [Solenopsis invicta]|uniref:uncharacterized protein LOC113003203 isoform X2 n=1 Tax=Solenopsis invicta TaxID=13686 RepID=UPI00193E2D0C|nr:uncharacterized protein LOC113003203 isoform X2 [Solenopsis invicta]
MYGLLTNFVAKQISREMLRDVLLHLLISAVGILIGMSAFFVLFIVYGNHEVGFWSILAGALAGVCFHLHWVKGKETLERWHTRVTLRNLNVVGFISAVTGVTALICYSTNFREHCHNSGMVYDLWKMGCYVNVLLKQI